MPGDFSACCEMKFLIFLVWVNKHTAWSAGLVSSNETNMFVVCKCIFLSSKKRICWLLVYLKSLKSLGKSKIVSSTFLEL